MKAEAETVPKGYRNRLIEELIARQRRNPAYSLRSFARDLQVSPAALSQTFNGKRNLSRSSLLKVADKLCLTPSERNQALNELSGLKNAIPDDEFRLLQDDTFHFISDWYYFAILSLAQAGKAKNDPNWLSKRFGISPMEARTAVERLARLKLVQIKNEKICYDGKPLRSTTDVPSSAARILQKNHIRLAEDSLEKDLIHLRDMTSMTMAIKLDRIPKAKEMIKSFRRKLSRFLEAGGCEEVYVLAVQLFPVTKPIGKLK